MYARKLARSQAPPQSVSNLEQIVVQSPPRVVIHSYTPPPKQIPPIQLSEEHSLLLLDRREGITNNLMAQNGEPITYHHPNQVIAMVMDKAGSGVRTGVYNHEDVSVSRILDDIPEEIIFNIGNRQSRKDGITIDDEDTVKTELIDKLSIIPELTKEYLVASKDLSVIEPVAEVADISASLQGDNQVATPSVADKAAPLSSEIEAPLVAQSSAPLNVAEMSVTDKLGEAMKRAASKLPKAVGEQLLAMVNPTSLAVMVGVLGAYAASHAVGIGVIADAVMAVGAGLTIGWQAVTAAKDLWGFAQFINANSEEDLDKAGQHLANFVATVGIDIVIGILVRKAAGKAKNYGDDLNRVDEVSAHSDNVSPSRVNDVDNANTTTNQRLEVQPTRDVDLVESSTQESPNFKGSGPAPGIIEISAGVKSTKAIENLNPKRPMDFVFDPVNKRLVVGSRRSIPHGHDGIMDAASRGIRNPNSVGGRIGRRDGILYTDEWSGHYGDRWDDTLRQQFESFKQEFGLDIPHLGDFNLDHLTK